MSYLGYFSISFEKITFYMEVLLWKVELWIFSLVSVMKKHHKKTFLITVYKITISPLNPKKGHFYIFYKKKISYVCIAVWDSQNVTLFLKIFLLFSSPSSRTIAQKPEILVFECIFHLLFIYAACIFLLKNLLAFT